MMEWRQFFEDNPKPGEEKNDEKTTPVAYFVGCTQVTEIISTPGVELLGAARWPSSSVWLVVGWTRGRRREAAS